MKKVKGKMEGGGEAVVGNVVVPGEL
jgi:hypothetical protein